MRAAIVTRVSTAEQAEQGHHSLAYQREAMEQIAAARGWEIASVYEIPGESAYKWDVEERPQFMAAIDAACRREFDVLLVYDVSRLARNQRFLHEVRYRLRAAGVELWSAAGGYDAVADGMRAGMEGIVAEQASIDHSRRVQAAYRRRHALGLHTGDVPFGYRSEGPSAPASVVADEADAVRWAFEAYASGTGYLAIASEFNRLGLRPRTKRRDVSAFSVSSIQSLLETRYYVGVVTHRGHEAPGRHKAIITEAEWQRANSRVRRRGAHATRSYTAVMAGLTRCARCDGPIWTTSSGPKRHTYYFEPARDRGRTCPVAGRSWRHDKADGVMAEIVGAMKLGPWFEAAEALALRSDAADVLAQRGHLEERRERILEMYELGATREAVQRRLARIDAELRALPLVDARAAEAAGERFTAAAEAWEVARPEQRNRWLRLTLDGVMLDVAEHQLWVQPAEEFREYFEARRLFVTAGCTPDRTPSLVLPSPSWFRPAELVA